MFDLKTKKMFLKKTITDQVVLTDLYMGSIITLLSRKLKIVEYADVFTRKFFETKRSKFAD